MKMWQWVFFGLMMTILTPAYAQINQVSSHIEVVGNFSNMRFTEEHQYGYEIQLCRQGDKFFGLFEAAAGLAGDTPTGMLEKISFDPPSGKLSFAARLTTGMDFANGKETPSHDLFEFTGILKGTSVSGTLKHQDMLYPASKPEVETVQLNQQSGEVMGTLQAATYAEWKQQADKILKRLGPRW